MSGAEWEAFGWATAGWFVFMCLLGLVRHDERRVTRRTADVDGLRAALDAFQARHSADGAQGSGVYVPDVETAELVEASRRALDALCGVRPGQLAEAKAVKRSTVKRERKATA